MSRVFVYFQAYADCRVSSTFKWKGMWTREQPAAPQVFSSPATPSAGGKTHFRRGRNTGERVQF